jgi:opacity protein-like surface antigen
MRRINFAVAALAFAAIAPVAAAQSTNSKITLGVHAGMVSNELGSGDEELAKTKSGANFGVVAGYDFSPALRFTLGVDRGSIGIDEEGASSDDNFALTTIDLGARYSFVSSARRITPFVNAGVSRRMLSAEVEGLGDLTANGIGFNLGAGVDYALSPKMSLGGSFGYTMGKIGNFELDGESDESDTEFDGNGYKVNVGLTFRPF